MENNNLLELESLDDLDDMIEKINAFIVPNIAKTQIEKHAVGKAAAKQLLYEKNLKSNFGDKDIPPNVSGFRIGNFAMNFHKNNSELLNKKNISPVAYAILLNAGLLYKGVNR